jgi:hypothetical protein
VAQRWVTKSDDPWVRELDGWRGAASVIFVLGFFVMLVCVVDRFKDCQIIIPNVHQTPLCDDSSVKIGDERCTMSFSGLFTIKAREFTPIPYDSNSVIFTTRKKTVTANQWWIDLAPTHFIAHIMRSF